MHNYIKVDIKVEKKNKSLIFSDGENSCLKINDVIAKHYDVVDLNVLRNPDLFRLFIERMHVDFLSSSMKSPIIVFSDIDQTTVQEFVESKPHTSIIFNSSIWIRHINKSENKQEEYDEIERQFKSFNQNYTNNNNAIEYFEYQLRLQSVNYLKPGEKDSKSHGIFIAPTLYSNEIGCKTFLENINSINGFSDMQYIKTIYNCTYNILLIDDKKANGKYIESLMNLGKLDDNLEIEFKETFSDSIGIDKKTVWAEKSVVHFLYENDNELFSFLESTKPPEQKKTRIIQVKKLRDAVKLLTRSTIGNKPIKFDIILVDYLLEEEYDEKGKVKPGETKREYMSDLFQWITKRRFPDKITVPLEEDANALSDLILLNRGPLEKLWVFPITSFNQAFLDDLRNKGVRLIDYYWHISRGADPINTPYLFLRMLNNFLYLQVQQAVYNLKTLTTFLNKTITRIDNINEDDFQPYMGSEYTVLIQKHGWRSVISRDNKAGSLFSNYIWTNFYSNSEYKHLFRLMDKMQKFFHVCTFADETDYDKMMLYWKELDIFITDYWTELTNEYADKIIDSIGNCTTQNRDEERKSITCEDKIIKPELSSFRNKINKFLDKNKN